MKPEQFDLSDPTFWSDPNDFFASMRSECPVFSMPEGQGYLVATYEGVKSASSMPQVFSSTRPIFGGGDPELEAIQEKGYPIVPTMSNNDPPRHTRYRKLVNRAFAPAVVEQLEDSMHDIAHGIIDRLEGRTEFDFCREYADVLPSYVMADWLGVAREDQPRFKKWSDDMVESTLSPTLTRERQIECKLSFVEFQQYFAAIIEQRRGGDGEDAVSLLVNSHVVDERPLDVPEILDLLRQFLIAGNDTTANLLGGTMLLLLDHPETFAEVVADRSLIPDLIEEALRHVTPAQWTMRTVVADSELSGCPVSAGERARVALASANRDPEQFEDPDVFDIKRDATGHVAFGHGIHFCIGHLLGRAEARIAFEVLFDRLSDIRLAVPREKVKRRPLAGIYQLQGLPLHVAHIDTGLATV